MENGLTSLKDLINKDNVFEVPIYQRNYSWDKRQLEELWSDLIYLDEGKKHYFGTILLKETGKPVTSGLKSFRVYEVIDGQQRLTTALILLKEVISRLKEIYRDPRQIEYLERDYLKFNGVYKLRLLGDDDEFFRRFIVNDEKYLSETLTPSRARLREAKLFFKAKIHDELERHFKTGDSESFLLSLKGKIERLEIIRYNVERDSDAALVFESVNDRGKPLSKLDKTKSFLMHMVYLSEPQGTPSKVQEVNESFSKIFRYLETITYTDTGRKLDEEDVQRYHYIIYETSYYSDWFDELRKKIRDKYQSGKKEECLGYCLEYSKDLEKAFFAVKEILCYKRDDDLGFLLGRLFTLDRLGPYYPLLIAAWIKYQDNIEKLREVLRLVEVFTFRVNVIARGRGGEARLLSLANDLYGRDRNESQLDIVKELKDAIVSWEPDEDLRGDMSDKRFYQRHNSNDIKYLLFEYERHLSAQAKEPLHVDPETIFSDLYEVEHIMAQNPEQGVPEELRSAYEQTVHRLGNLTLASKNWNAHWQNKPFRVKKNEYQDSSFRVQRELSQISDWDERQIESREQGIITYAIERWRV